MEKIIVHEILSYSKRRSIIDCGAVSWSLNSDVTLLICGYIHLKTPRQKVVCKNQNQGSTALITK